MANRPSRRSRIKPTNASLSAQYFAVLSLQEVALLPSRELKEIIRLRPASRTERYPEQVLQLLRCGRLADVVARSSNPSQRTSEDRFHRRSAVGEKAARTRSRMISAEHSLRNCVVLVQPFRTSPGVIDLIREKLRQNRRRHDCPANQRTYQPSSSTSPQSNGIVQTRAVRRTCGFNAPGCRSPSSSPRAVISRSDM